MLKEEEFLNSKPVIWYKRIAITAVTIGILFIVALIAVAVLQK